MSEIVPFRLESGETVYIEVMDAPAPESDGIDLSAEVPQPAGNTRRGPAAKAADAVGEAASESLEMALESAKSAAAVVVKAFKELNEPEAAIRRMLAKS